MGYTGYTSTTSGINSDDPNFRKLIGSDGGPGGAAAFGWDGNKDYYYDGWSEDISTYQKRDLSEIQQLNDRVTAALANNSVSALDSAIASLNLDSLATQAENDATEADAIYSKLLREVTNAQNDKSDKRFHGTKDHTKTIKLLSDRAEAARKVAVDAHKRLDELKGNIDALTSLRDEYDAKAKADEAAKKSDDARSKADAIADASKETGGSQDAARQREADAQKALDVAENAVSDLEAALTAANDAISNAKGSSPENLRKLREIRDNISKQLEKAKANQRQVEKDLEAAQEATKKAADAEAEKDLRVRDEFKKKILKLIEEIKNTTSRASLQNVRDMLTASQYAAQQMKITGEATITQAQISLASEKMTVQQQLSELAMRAGATGYSNLLAQMAYAEAIREKAFNLEADIEKNRVDNAFTRAKAAAQLSKY